MIKVSNLSMNYLEELIGTIKMPQFSWEIECDYRNGKQVAYQLQIGKDQWFKDILFDSNIVKSEESAQVEINDFELESASKYWIRVKSKSNYDEWSDWSLARFFVTGILNINEWKAKLISAETLKDAEKSKGTYVRKSVFLKNDIEEAYAYTSALGLYHFHVNGKKISQDEMAPGWTAYNKRFLYQTYDLTDILHKGENVLGAHIGAGWYKGTMGLALTRNIYGKQTAFIGQVHIRYKNGEEEIIKTDESWIGQDSPVIFSEIYDGEIYDGRLNIENWDNIGENEHNWKSIHVLDFNHDKLEPQDGTRVAIIDEILPKRILSTPRGETVLDFGQNMTGWVEFCVNAQKGSRVEIQCFEVLDQDGNVYLDNLRGAKQTLIYYCKDNETERYAPHFTFQGFQYAWIKEYPGEIDINNFVAYTVHSNMKQTGYFECSNSDLNQLQHNILWGLKGNFVDIPTDCPQRNERLGWTGDAQIFSRTASFLMNTYSFFSKWIKDVALEQTAEGSVPHVVPDILTGIADHDKLLSQGTDGAAAWGDVAVIIPWTLYLTYGDRQIIRDQYDSMKAWIDYMNKYSKDNIWNYKLQFGDWVALDAEEGSYFGATPNELTCTAYYAYSTGLFAKMARVIGREDDYKKYNNQYQNIVKSFRENFFNEKGELIAQTQTSHVLALYFGLTPDKYKEKTVQRLVELIEARGGHLVTGFVGTPYICHSLSQNGRSKEAYELLLKDDFPSWLYQVKMGATTIWEHWDGIKPDGTMWSPNMNSFNHYAYGAIGEWLYRVVAGIEIDEDKPGYKHIIIQPKVGQELDYVKASYHSIYGDIQVRWTHEDQEVLLSVTIPFNTTATIVLDTCQEMIGADEIFFEETDGLVIGHIGSGTYTIKYK